MSKPTTYWLPHFQRLAVKPKCLWSHCASMVFIFPYSGFDFTIPMKLIRLIDITSSGCYFFECLSKSIWPDLCYLGCFSIVSKSENYGSVMKSKAKINRLLSMFPCSSWLRWWPFLAGMLVYSLWMQCQSSISGIWYPRDHYLVVLVGVAISPSAIRHIAVQNKKLKARLLDRLGFLLDSVF